MLKMHTIAKINMTSSTPNALSLLSLLNFEMIRQKKITEVGARKDIVIILNKGP